VRLASSDPTPVIPSLGLDRLYSFSFRPNGAFTYLLESQYVRSIALAGIIFLDVLSLLFERVLEGQC